MMEQQQPEVKKTQSHEKIYNVVMISMPEMIRTISHNVEAWSSVDDFGLKAEEVESYLNEQLKKNTGVIFGAYDEGFKWVGFVSLSYVHKRFYNVDVLTDDFFIVRPEYRNKKVSSCLVDAIKNFVKMRNLYAVEINPSTLTGRNIEKIKMALENKGFQFSGYMMTWRNEHG